MARTTLGTNTQLAIYNSEDVSSFANTKGAYDMEYIDVLKLAGRLFDCMEYEDMRGRYVENKRIINYEGCDLSGCVFYRCYPSEFSNALEIEPCENEFTLEEDANLWGAKLQGAKLQGANLKGAELQWAELEGANLQDANLEGANLRYVKLEGVNLQDANLHGANLSFADLRGANFEDANLHGATLYNANLQGANLQGAKYNQHTTFKDSDITQEQLDSMVNVELI